MTSLTSTQQHAARTANRIVEIVTSLKRHHDEFPQNPLCSEAQSQITVYIANDEKRLTIKLNKMKAKTCHSPVTKNKT